ncbi:NAD(P)-binding protein [Delitschia confertaspora ATCC 74209]|uniref:NAD(P)-binding protein n=1 Tax=Delitschia confertaspora ATCC 74209 TaxID=1513339 RepID=A0A9P4JKV9_9PLEO|nr:NAD(P)-binding protein [Delitschia confertaspora ATCC 74209]
MTRRRILLTGACSLTGSHILHQLMSSNVSVCAVVASRDKAEILQKQYSQHSSALLDFEIVPSKLRNMPGAYTEAFTGSPEPFDTIIHTATADSSDEADCLTRFINLETENLVDFLRSIKENAPRVRRVVITTFLSPFAQWLVAPPAEHNAHGSNPSSPRTSEVDFEYVLATSRASDNIVNDHLWKWAKDVGVGFDLVSVTAPSVYGPSIWPPKNSTDFEEANRRIWNICCNDPTDETTSPPYGIEYFTDVRDLAFAHVQAAFTPEAGNKRFVVSAGVVPPRGVITEFFLNRFPELGSRIHTGHSPPTRALSGNTPLDLVDTTPTEAVLGVVKYRPFEETLTDLARQILELNRRREWRRVIQS